MSQEPSTDAEAAAEPASGARRKARRDRWTIVLATVIVILQLVTAPVVMSMAEDRDDTAADRDEAEEPEPEPEPEPAIEPQEFSGDQPGHSDAFEVEDGLTIFEITHDGGGNFIVELQDGEHERVTGLVNVIGDFDGSTATHLDAGEYVVAVRGHDWSVTVTQPRYAGADEPPVSYSGAHDRATEPFEIGAREPGPDDEDDADEDDADEGDADEGDADEDDADEGDADEEPEPRGVRFDITHAGDGNIRVILLDDAGRRVVGVLNDIGEVETTERAELEPGIYLLNVRADGDWSIDVDVAD